MESTEEFVTTFRVLNLYRMRVCEEHAHSHSIIDMTRNPSITRVSKVLVTSV